MLLSVMAMTVSSGLVAYYKMDETSGTTVFDYSGNGHHGTYMGGVPTWNNTGGQAGGALDMPAAASDHTIDAGTFDVEGSGLTLAAWVYQEASTKDARIISKTSSSTPGNHGLGSLR